MLLFVTTVQPLAHGATFNNVIKNTYACSPSYEGKYHNETKRNAHELKLFGAS